MKRNLTPLVIISNEKEIADLVLTTNDYDLLGVIDQDSNANTGGLPLLGPDEKWEEIRSKYPEVKVALALDPPVRKSRLFPNYGFEALATLISPDAYVASSVQLGRGCLIQRGVKIMPDAALGVACKVNLGASVHHDCSVGDFCTLAPGCRLLGQVVLEDEVFIGAGAIILPHVRVGAGVIVGAGAVVVKDVSAGTTVVGVPAKAMREEKRPA